MHHDPQQLDDLWAALKGADQDLLARVLDRYSNSRMPGARPTILCDDAQAQILGIPTPDHPGWHVYSRKPGGVWSQER